MAQEGNNNSIRRCSQISEDDELSMVDVLNEQARLQADADAVLGGSDENNCTYPQVASNCRFVEGKEPRNLW